LPGFLEKAPPVFFSVTPNHCGLVVYLAAPLLLKIRFFFSVPQIPPPSVNVAHAPPKFAAFDHVFPTIFPFHRAQVPVAQFLLPLWPVLKLTETWLYFPILLCSCSASQRPARVGRVRIVFSFPLSFDEARTLTWPARPDGWGLLSVPPRLSGDQTSQFGNFPPLLEPCCPPPPSLFAHGCRLISTKHLLGLHQP